MILAWVGEDEISLISDSSSVRNRNLDELGTRETTFDPT